MDSLIKYQSIFELVQLIPKGKVCSYGIIAKYSGPGITARMVGRALSLSENLKNIPAHRVVNSQGKLTGKMQFKSPTLMQELLEAEGIIVKNDRIQQFANFLWTPEALI